VTCDWAHLVDKFKLTTNGAIVDGRTQLSQPSATSQPHHSVLGFVIACLAVFFLVDDSRLEILIGSDL